jgi:membrane associated rhomboid family serine protease
MTPTPVGMRCPECARQRTKVRSGPAAYSTDPTATYVLIAANVIVFLGVAAGGAGLGNDYLASEIGRQGVLFGPAVADGDFWRLVTNGFIHAGPIHLALNMFLLYILGTMLEPAIGRMRFLLIYFVSLLFGSFGVLLVGPHDFAVGASGAVFGLMGGGVVVLRNRGIDPMQSGLPFLIGFNLLFTFLIPGISIGAHIGGLIGGALTAALLFDVPERIRVPQIVPTVLAGVLGAAAIAGSIAIAG